MCPHCGASLPPVRDAFCPLCRGDLTEPTAGPPVRAQPLTLDRLSLTAKQRATLRAYREFRTAPPTTFRLLGRAALVELLRAAVLGGLAGVLYHVGFPLLAAAVAGVAVGAFLRDLGQFMDSAEVWPVIVAVTDWQRVDDVLAADDR